MKEFNLLLVAFEASDAVVPVGFVCTAGVDTITLIWALAVRGV